MIIKSYALALLTEDEAIALRVELLRVFEKKTSKDLPQLAEILRNLSILTAKKQL